MYPHIKLLGDVKLESNDTESMPLNITFVVLFAGPIGVKHKSNCRE